MALSAISRTTFKRFLILPFIIVVIVFFFYREIVNTYRNDLDYIGNIPAAKFVYDFFKQHPMSDCSHVVSLLKNVEVELIEKVTSEYPQVICTDLGFE